MQNLMNSDVWSTLLLQKNTRIFPKGSETKKEEGEEKHGLLGSGASRD